MTLDAVIAFARRLHAEQADLVGTPYVEHLRRVAGRVPNAAKPVAWLHDAIEDTDVDPAELRGLVGDVGLEAVVLLTRREDETYGQFIDRVATAEGDAGDLARTVKVADLRDNLGRMSPALAEARPDLVNRYMAALTPLGANPDEEDAHAPQEAGDAGRGSETQERPDGLD